VADQNDLTRHYEIGRGKPPKHTQFVKGKSGNLKGRPKGSKNFSTTIRDELKRRVTITEDGRRRRITKREAVAKQLVNKAVTGDSKAMPLLFNETRADEHNAEGANATLGISNPVDRLVLENIINRIRDSNALLPSAEAEEALLEQPPAPAAEEQSEHP
jgi:Family of unknown function (DUF5681)